MKRALLILVLACGAWGASAATADAHWGYGSRYGGYYGHYYPHRSYYGGYAPHYGYSYRSYYPAPYYGYSYRPYYPSYHGGFSYYGPRIGISIGW